MCKKSLLFLLLLNLLFCERVLSDNVNVGVPLVVDCSVKTVDLSGQWQFYYGKYFSAKEMKMLGEADKHVITIPQNWAKLEIKGHPLPAFGIATYYRQVVVKNASRNHIYRFGMHVNSVASAYSLWINGKLAGVVGSPTVTSKNFRPIYLPSTFYFTSYTDTIDIVLHVSNFFSRKYAGISQSVSFGQADDIKQLTRRRYLVACLVICIFLLMFIRHISICPYERQEQSHWVIAVLSLVFMIKTLMDGDFVIYHLWPNLDFEICYRAWLSIFVAITLIVRLMRISFPNEISVRIARSIDVVFGIYLIWVWVSSLKQLQDYLFVYVFVTVVVIAYLISVLIRAIVRRRKYAIVQVVSFVVMFLTFISDLVSISHPLPWGYISHLGTLFYVFVQSVIVIVRWSQYYRNTVQLSAALETANRTLEETVKQRTQDLQYANESLIKVNRQKDFLISTITHDLINSFNTLLTFTKYLAEDKTLSDKHRQQMAMLYRTSDKGYNILDNVLSWAKLQIADVGNLHLIKNLTAIVDVNVKALSIGSGQKNIEVKIEVDDSLHFRCDEGNLNTILRNLLSNAIKFSKRNGIIRISNRLQDDFVQILVEDEGIGMSETLLQSLFHSQQSTMRKGTEGEGGAGIGLFIVRELVENNHGTICCSSIPERGSVFVVAFKLV